jgi:hypothetical protein
VGAVADGVDAVRPLEWEGRGGRGRSGRKKRKREGKRKLGEAVEFLRT